MSYSFFGTCYQDHTLVKSCIISILRQTINPKEIIIVDSGNSIEFKNWFVEKTTLHKIKPIYINENLPRVVALNKAIDFSSSQYLLRFDSRSEFPNNYAYYCIEKLNSGYKIVGGVPMAFCKTDNLESNLCKLIMNSSYIFGYPKYRNNLYEGFANSVYLGAFDASLLKKIKYRSDIKIISEDSLLAQDFTINGFKPYISKKIKPKYRVREEIISIFKLFNTYGYSRANSIICSRSFHEKGKFLIIFVFLFSILLSTFLFSFKNIFLTFLILLFFYNFIGEALLRKRKLNIIVPVFAMFCQFFWIIGLIQGISLFKIAKSKTTNFIK